jgi:DNA-binding LacI/PurR family transcriptional regulator
MGYVTNRLARTLRTGESNVLALVVPKVDSPFFGAVYLGAESAANAAGYTLSLVRSRNTQNTQEIVVQHLVERAVDGFVLWQPMNPSMTKRYANRIVTVEHRIPGVSSVEFAVNQAMHTLLSHANKRYQSIIHLTVDLPDATFVMRREAFVAFGQQYPSVQMRQIRVPFDFGQIIRILLPLFEAQRDQPTLYCCDDDMLAAAVYHMAYRQTQPIPQQVAVMSLGGSAVAELLFPTLTHIKLPAFELGSHAIRFLISTLHGHAPQSMVLPGAFVQGHST